MAIPLAAGLELVSEHRLAKPSTAKTTTPAPSNIELDAIVLPDHGLLGARDFDGAITPNASHTPYDARTPSLTQHQESRTPNELEQSRPPTPKRDTATVMIPSFSYPSMNKWRVLSVCLEYFGNGLNDSAPGALIPYIESWYDIGYAVVSIIWIANALGFILCAFSTDFISGRLGRSRSLMLSEAILITAYVVIACPVPYPVVVVAYLVLGFGEALNLALNNVFTSNLANPTVILGGAHGSYGVGGILGPIVATGLVSTGIHWSRFYIVAL